MVVPEFQTPYIAKVIVTPQDAIATHVRWKITLSLAVTLREPLTERATRSIQHIEECSIHKWLLSGHTRHLHGTPEYRAVCDLHVEFHVQMLQIANLLNSGDFAEAERRINAPTPFQSASNALANAVMALSRHRPSSPLCNQPAP